MWFTPSKIGRYHIFCTQYCGTKHSNMIGWVTVMDPADYQAWLAANSAGGTMVENGARLFADLSCNTCHTDTGQAARGPALKNVFGHQVLLQGLQTTTADDAYLRESILNPQAKIVSGFQPMMPTFQGLVTEEQLLQLIAYVKSLSDNQQPGAAGAATPPAPAVKK
jgi:cytochrome c oxidase subunit II